MERRPGLRAVSNGLQNQNLMLDSITTSTLAKSISRGCHYYLVNVMGKTERQLFPEAFSKPGNQRVGFRSDSHRQNFRFHQRFRSDKRCP